MSYMWYIHVLVKVNTEERLRANIARFLNLPTSPSSTRKASSTPPLHPSGFIPCSTTGQPQVRQPRRPKTDTLTDHLILWVFNHTILTHLVNSTPVLEQANGYMRVLADIPQPLRKEFFQRLYMLLFSKRIVEWPHGIDMPEPAIAVANCRVGPGQAYEGVASTRREDALLEPSPQLGARLDGVVEEAALFQTEDEGQSPTSASSSAAAESSSMHTPSRRRRLAWAGTATVPTTNMVSRESTRSPRSQVLSSGGWVLRQSR